MPFVSSGLIQLWTDPAATGLNKLPARSPHRFHPDDAGAKENSNSPWEVDLCGDWDFLTACGPAEAESLIAKTDLEWQSIRVPGHPELQGFGMPHYTNITMPFPDEPPSVPRINPTGLYRKKIQVPSDWNGLRMVLHFGSAESFLAVWVNDQPVGMGKGSRLPSEFDITPLAVPGETIEIRALVAKWSDACFIEDQDMWWLSGLPRRVALLAMPAVHAADVFVRSHLNADGSGRLSAEVTVSPPAEIPNSAGVELQLFDPSGHPVFKAPLQAEAKWTREPNQHFRGIARFDQDIAQVDPWNHESPALYTALVTVCHGDSVSHSAIKTGFRRIEVCDGALLVNGRRVLFCGVNRHGFDPVYGRAVPEETMRRDITLMKKFHFNAVRCSHYPPDSRWLELCDEVGLYVIDEADIESHAYHNSLCNDTRFAAAWLDRTIRMVERDKNHPSVIAWSLGNESGHGANHDACAGWVRHRDSSRPVHYEGAVSEFQSGLSYLHGSLATDIICPMYPEIQRLREAEDWLETLSLDNAPPASPQVDCRSGRPLEKSLLRPWDRPIILCEYSHAMGNSNGSLADYFALFRSSRRIQGGFIWEWMDHGILRKDSKGRPYFAYGGDFGDTPNDANFVCDGLVSSDRQPHPAMWEHRFLAQPVHAMLRDPKTLEIHNRQDFSDTAWLSLEWTLLTDGEPVASGPLEVPVSLPQESVTCSMPDLPLAEGKEHHWRLTWRAAVPKPFFDLGEEVAYVEIPISSSPKKIMPPSGESPQVKREAGRLGVDTGVFSLQIEEATGRWLSLETPAGPLCACDPKANLWRAAIDNDGIKLWDGQESKPLGRWLALGLDALSEKQSAASIETGTRGETLLTTRRHLSGRQGGSIGTFETRFVFDARDSLLVRHRLEFSGEEFDDLPRIGVLWTLAPGLEHLRYFGLGPQENYPDRRSAALLGVHAGTVSSEFFPYVMPQETGHHGNTRWVELSSIDGRRLRFEFETPLGFSALHFTPEMLFSAKKQTDLESAPETFLCIDAVHRGLGTGSCGPDTLPKYHTGLGPHEWSYRIWIL